MIPLSILIPVYNQARYLPECIESVLNQQFKEFEVIAVNDGSTDESLSILEHYAVLDARIKVISKDNEGYGSAMNVALRHAEGKYIGIVESDDTIDPPMYRELIEAAEQTGADIVKCSFRRVFSNRLSIEEKEWLKAAGSVFCLKDHPEVCRLHPAIWAAVYKKQFLEKNDITFSLTPGASYQDVVFFADTFSAAESIYVIPKTRYNYRLESANAFSSSNAIDEKVFYRMKNHQLAMATYQKHGIWEDVKYAELQREFITLNNYALRINAPLRRRLYYEIQDYFISIPIEDTSKFLPPNFRTSFKLVKKGEYFRWFLQYAIGYIIIIRISKMLGLIDIARRLYLRRKNSKSSFISTYMTSKSSGQITSEHP